MYSYLLPAVSIVAGLLVLILGGALLVRGASGLAARIGLSPLVIGLTVVVLGTTAPELVMTAVAAHRSETDLAVGTIVGGNIFNVLFVLGLSAIVAPLTVAARLIRLNVPVMILSSLALLVLGWNDVIRPAEGAGLLVAAVIYMAWTVYLGRREQPSVRQELAQRAQVGWVHPPKNLVVQLALILAGSGLLSLGSYCLVEIIVDLAARLDLNKLFVGLTVLAAGTSLPVLATSLVATFRRHCDIAVGNVLGSSILSMLGILAVAALMSPHGLNVPTAALRFDIPVMIATSILCVPIVLTGCVLTRWEGLLFLGYYAAYVTYLTLGVLQPATSMAYGQLIVMVFIPATIILVMIGVLKTLRRGRPKRPLKHRIRGI